MRRPARESSMDQEGVPVTSNRDQPRMHADRRDDRFEDPTGDGQRAGADFVEPASRPRGSMRGPAIPPRHGCLRG